jgi:hypothetical protein
MEKKKLVQIGIALSIACGAIGIHARSAQALTCPQTVLSWDENEDFSAGVACCTFNDKDGCSRGFTDSFNNRFIQAFGENVGSCGCGGQGWIAGGLNVFGTNSCVTMTPGNDVDLATQTAGCPSSAVFSRISKGACPPC